MNSLDKALIGCCFIDAQICNEVMSEAIPEWFNSEWMNLFEEMKNQYDKDGLVDPVLFYNNPNLRDQALESTSFVPSISNYRQYLEQIKNRFVKKSLIQSAKLFFSDGDIEKYQIEVDRIIGSLSPKDCKCKNLSEDLMEYADLLSSRKDGKIETIQTGYFDLDKITGGLSKGDLVVIGARTSKGKSAACINLSSRFLMSGYSILYISSEMTYNQVMDRLVSLRSFVSLGKLRWKISNEDYKKATESLVELHKKPMIVFEGGFLNLPKIKNLIEKHKPKVVFVDYIQGFIPPQKTNNRAAYYSEIAYSLKALAQQYKLTIIAASQFSRQIEYSDREPTLADFKESGGIEEAADICILLHPKNKKEQLDSVRPYEWIVAKDRNGPCGKIPFVFHEKFTRFEEGNIEEKDDRTNGLQNEN